MMMMTEWVVWMQTDACFMMLRLTLVLAVGVMDVSWNGSKIEALPKKDVDIDVRDQINTIEALWAKACFCSGDKYVVNLLAHQNHCDDN